MQNISQETIFITISCQRVRSLSLFPFLFRKKKEREHLGTSDFQSEVGEVFGKIGGELPAKFGRRFLSFCWGNRQKHFPPKLHRKFHHQTSLRGSGWRAGKRKALKKTGSLILRKCKSCFSKDALVKAMSEALKCLQIKSFESPRLVSTTNLLLSLSFPATEIPEPPDPRRVPEGFEKGFLKGFRRV